MMRSTPCLYSVNTRALGDAVAAAPVVKWAVENLHTNGCYLVSVADHFKCLFPFVEPSKFFPVDEPYVTLKGDYGVFELNDVRGRPRVSRLTPSKLSLSYYASINLLGRLLPHDAYNYVPLDLSKFEHTTPIPNAVILVASHRDANRAWPGGEILKTAEWVKTQGFLPVLVGQSTNPHVVKQPVSSVHKAPDYVMDLRDTLDIPTLAFHLSTAKAVAGVDSGVIHLAGTTQTPIIAGYTNVDPETRIPQRANGVFIPITPKVACRFCQSNWQLPLHSFDTCLLGTSVCVDEMSAGKFIQALETVLEAS